MKFIDAIKRNPYDPKKGTIGAYIRYFLRYIVKGWWGRKSEDIRKGNIIYNHEGEPIAKVKDGSLQIMQCGEGISIMLKTERCIADMVFQCEKCGSVDACERCDIEKEPVLCDDCYGKELYGIDCDHCNNGVYRGDELMCLAETCEPKYDV